LVHSSEYVLRLFQLQRLWDIRHRDSHNRYDQSRA
jgi:hypothetical protein